MAAGLLAALAAEFVDELVDGTGDAALPLIRHGLGLSYAEIGLLAAVPLIAGSLIEMPMGILATSGRRRRRMILAGGLVLIASLLLAAAAPSFPVLLAAVVIFFPASGAFIGLTQADLMDAAPGRQAALMARWTVAGALGAVAGPLLLAAVVAAGASWRAAYLILAATAAAAWLGVAAAGRPRSRPGSAEAGSADDGPAGPGPAGPGPAGSASGAPANADLASPGPTGSATGGPTDAGPDKTDPDGVTARRAGDPEPQPASLRQAVSAARRPGVLRWLVLLQVTDLLGDTLTGFVALYLVAVAGVSPGQAALGVGVRLGGDLIGAALAVPLLERLPGRVVLRLTAALALALYPAFLLVPGFGAKLAVLAVLSVATAAWYPAATGELYASLPGASGVAVSLVSAATLVGGLGPLAVGLAAGWLGLGWALAGLAVVPACVLAGAAGRRGGAAG
jgi:FSR family fosmidomycin resistance protein-like MFS transporter